MIPRARLVAAVAGLALLGACASAPVTRYYVLSATAPATAHAGTKPVGIVVSDVSLPQYLDRSQIVVRGSGHRVLMIENELWAGNLREDMTRVLVANLAGLLGSERVIAAPHPQRVQPDYRVAVEVLRFERGADGRVELSARWWLTRAADGTVLASPVEALSGPALPDQSGYEAVVASMSAVYGELAMVIARRISAAAVAN